MLLKQHPIDKPIKGPKLAAKLGIDYDSMRELAAYLTGLEEIEIGSDNRRGFYWAFKPEDMDPKIEQLESRAIANLRHRKGARRAKRRLEQMLGVKRPQMDLGLVFQSPSVITQSNDCRSAV